MNEVINFIKKHKDFYPEYLINNRLQKCKFGYTCDIDQIYCYLNQVDIKDTIYFNFYELSCKYFNLKNKNLLEVACGYIPILSSIYKENNISVEATNIKILIKNYKGVKTIEYDLNKNYNLKHYDLIIAIRPCSITEHLLDNCYKYKKDFMIYLCPCIHKPKSGDTISSYEEWIIYLKRKTTKFKNYDIQFITPKNFIDNCPVIIGYYLEN